MRLARQVIALDAAWKETAARLASASEDARVRLVAGSDGRVRLHVQHLDALNEPQRIGWLRGTAAAMLPRVDLPELLLEVHAWTGFLNGYTHLADPATRTKDLIVSIAALLVAEACSVGLTPDDAPARTRRPDRHNYQRRLSRQLTIQVAAWAGSQHLPRQPRPDPSALRRGQEDRLATLGLVLDAVVLWNTRYLDAIVDRLRTDGDAVRDEDVARLSPLGHAHLNCLGWYAFAATPPTQLRPLRDSAGPADTDDSW